ncbi:DUF6351 family protein [soil metagenome]
MAACTDTSKSMTTRFVHAGAWLLVLAIAPAASAAPSSAAPAPDAIRIVSSSPDRVSGGDALVSVVRPRDGNTLRVMVGSRDVTKAFALDPHDRSRLVGLVSELPVGNSTLTVETDGKPVSLQLTNYPITGPIISGPHQVPFMCQTTAFSLPDGSKLDAPIDKDCSIEPVVSYLYLAQRASSLPPLTDRDRPPANVAMTKTLGGATVPFIVRVETRTVDRGIYQSAILHDPFNEPDPSPAAPPKGWNRRLIAVQGFGCPGGWYVQGDSMGNISSSGFEFSLLNLGRLGEGNAMFSNTLLHASNNCNAVLASEAAAMSKERFIKSYGVPSFTVSAGCSGGSYGGAMPADRMPGLFDGVMLVCTYPDPLAIALAGSDAHLLVHYFAETDGVGFTDEQRVAVSGFKGLKAFVDASYQCGRTDPISNRIYTWGYPPGAFNNAVPEALRYHPKTNPKGARATLYDASKNIYGVDSKTGFALRPFDNIGVQYGLDALKSGAISPLQFISLNEQIDGYDQDANVVAERSTGDAGAMERAQKGGLQLGGNGGLKDIPIMDVTGTYNEDGLYHYQWYHFAVRDRLAIANGNADNHVMWRGNPVPAETAWKLFIDWVAAFKADTSQRSLREKAIASKPKAAVDGCWKSKTEFVKERQTLGHDPGSVCNRLLPSWSFPRHVAGGPVAAHILKCSLKPLVASDYPVKFSADEWARLNKAFPGGVCDWSRPGNYTGVVADGSFGPAPGKRVYDITQP